MNDSTTILLGGGEGTAGLRLRMANRHGLIAGATGTGTGKTVTLQVLAENFSRAIGSQVGRQIVRGVLGALLGGGRRR